LFFACGSVEHEEFMANRTGLKKVVKTVRGKKGTVKRSYWVKAQGAASKAGGFVKKHAGKIAGAAAVVGEKW
jgi:ElaB/YqjD/DUF883 family membrane-anchored ribosome-binding protein